MKNARRLSLLAPIMVSFVLLAETSLAQSNFTLTSLVQVQNISGSSASVTLNYYALGGTTPTAVVDTISANNEKFYFPLSGVASGFKGSLEVTSNQQVKAATNIYGSGSANTAASYVGFDQGSTSVSLPLLMKNNSGFDTWFSVQNTGTGDATVNVSYSDGSAAGPTVIKRGAAATFDQAAETHTKAFFAGTVTSNQPIVVTVFQENANTMFAYNGFPSGSGATNLVIPLVNQNNSGFFSGVQIQNQGASATTVTLSYTPSIDGTACTETQTIQPGAMNVFSLFPFANIDPSVIVSGATSDCDDLHPNKSRFIGSARVTSNSSNQPLVAVTNQLSPTTGEAFGGYNPTNATNKFVAPIILDRYSAQDYWTSINLMNVGGSSASVQCTFSDSAFVWNSGSIASNGSASGLFFNQLGTNYVGSATCTGGAGSKIVAVINQLAAIPNGDNLLVYEGLNTN